VRRLFVTFAFNFQRLGRQSFARGRCLFRGKLVNNLVGPQYRIRHAVVVRGLIDYAFFFILMGSGCGRLRVRLPRVFAGSIGLLSEVLLFLNRVGRIRAAIFGF
jgi:hypothetical protein